MMTPIPLTNHIEIIERLMKSKRAYEDIKLSYKYNTPIYLFMIEWDENINIRHEFRCFIKNKQLIGISQYDLYSDSIYMKCELNNITLSIKSFINNIDYVEPNYVVDVYIDQHGCCYLIEINPYDKTTSAINFSWNELNNDYDFGNIMLKYKLYGCVNEYNINN